MADFPVLLTKSRLLENVVPLVQVAYLLFVEFMPRRGAARLRDMAF